MSNEKEQFEEVQASSKKMASWACGTIIGFYLEIAYATFIFFFYEVEVGLPVIYVGLALVIFAIWNAINDPLIGYLTDRPFKWSEKRGFRFPWIMIGVFPTLICYLILYTPPVGADDITLFFYLLFTLCLFDLVFSLFYVHYYGSFTMQFRTDEERRKAGAYSSFIPSIGALGVSIIPPIFIVFGDRESYALAALLVVIVLAIFAIISIPGVRETQEITTIYIQAYKSAEKVSFFGTLRTALKNKNFRAYTFGLLLVETCWIMGVASELYVFKHILGVPYSYALISILTGFLAFAVAVPFWFWVAKKIGHAKAYKLGTLLFGLTQIPYIFVNTFIEYVIFYTIAGVGWSAVSVISFAIFADVSDEVALSMEKRLESTLTGIRVFVMRLSVIITAIVIVSVHIMTGYNPDATAQTPLATWGIRLHFAVIPALVVFVAFIVLIKWYDLEGEKKEKLFAALESKGLR